MNHSTRILEGKTPTHSGPFQVGRVRSDFPILGQEVRGRPLVYLDNAATTQKPRSVVDAIVKFYSEDCSNIHRGVHTLSQRATGSYEAGRRMVRRFINAAEEREVIFVRGATEGINLVAHSFVRDRLSPGDEILISAMEHHSNIVPWQILCHERGASLRVIPMNSRGELLLDEYERLLGSKTRFLAVTQVSNSLGTVNPLPFIIQKARSHGVPVLVDGAQAVPHMKVDVRELDCDFYVFSGHKTYGPTGAGVLYGKSELLEAMPPYQGGGDMISSVTFEKTTYNRLPYKFEAGTPDIAAVIGLGAAIEYLDGIGMDSIADYEQGLLSYATEALSSLEGVRIIGTAREKAGVIAFVMEGIHPHDIGTILDQEGIAIRTGHHCAQPVMDFFHVPATARASISFYNTRSEIDALVRGIAKVKGVFG